MIDNGRPKKVLRAKGNSARKEKEKEFKKPKLYRFWNFLIYGTSIAIGVFLVYLYSAYVFINK